MFSQPSIPADDNAASPNPARRPGSIQNLSASGRVSGFLLIGLLVVFSLVWFSNLEYRKLVRPDEGRYAEIGREMVLSGDWVTPRLNDLKYFEKPPLQYWATAAAYRLFGEHHWTARWWPATATFGCVLLMFWAARRLYGDDDIALMAAAALGGCTSFVIDSHINTVDAGLTAFLTVALLGFLLAQRPGVTPAENRNGMLVVWAAMALAVLSKGLIGVVLPGAVLAIYVLIERDWRLPARLHPGKGLALFLLITAPWFVAVSLANDEFARFFFIHEHFARFLTKVHHRLGAWWYFVPILLFGAMPWTPFIGTRGSRKRCTPGACSSSGPDSSFCFSACRVPSCRPTFCRCFRRWRCSRRWRCGEWRRRR
jgi:4-amino-4-deoxy-L-arabinose transferase-like glycosyltransferase